MSSIRVKSSNLENLVVGPLSTKWSARGDRILRYYVDIRHTKMNLHREMSAPELFILQSKVDTLISEWDERYPQFILKQSFRSGKSAADDMTAEAIRAQEQLSRVLARTLSVNDAVDWEALKDRTPYPMPKSSPVVKPKTSPQPEPTYSKPTIGFFDVILGRKRSLLEQADARHAESIGAWQRAETNRVALHAKAMNVWKHKEAEFWAEHHHAKAELEAEQATSHSKVDALRNAVRDGDPDAVLEHVSLVLESSDYEGLFENLTRPNTGRIKKFFLSLLTYQLQILSHRRSL